MAIILNETLKIKKMNKSEIITNLLWTAFGIIGGLNYYSKEEYWICGILFLIAILYAYKLLKAILRN